MWEVAMKLLAKNLLIMMAVQTISISAGEYRDP